MFSRRASYARASLLELTSLHFSPVPIRTRTFIHLLDRERSLGA